MRPPLLSVWLLLVGLPSSLLADTLNVRVVDETRQPTACRIHLTDDDDVAHYPDDLPSYRDHFVCPGAAQLSLSPGVYQYIIERGPEYAPVAGSVEITAGEASTASAQLKRIANMAKRGWWSGDLHIHRDVAETPLHLQAEDLHIGPVITWWNERNAWREQSVPGTTLRRVDGNRFYDVMAGEDEREGGALLYFGLQEPLPLPGDARQHPEFPSPMRLVELARQRENVWIDIEKPFWWDVPLWLASGKMNSIGIANNHMCRSTMLNNEAWGKSRDRERLSSPTGNGYWTQEIYYHILNSGFRTPPSAGSASGVLPNPVGYNRVYVHLGPEIDYRQWWRGLAAGRSFVTNGPLLICRTNGEFPGYVFQSETDENLSLHVELISWDHVPAIEIIHNGQVVQTIPLARGPDEQFTKATVHVDLHVRETGWFLVRAITDRTDTFRFASTAPFYVEVGGVKSRRSRTSIDFFLQWLEQRIARVPAKLSDASQLRAVLAHHEAAQHSWRQLLKRANAD